jgi:hypothetical protein
MNFTRERIEALEAEVHRLKLEVADLRGELSQVYDPSPQNKDTAEIVRLFNKLHIRRSQ